MTRSRPQAGRILGCPPVLVYHILDARVDPKVAVPPELFSEQIGALAAAGYRGCSLSEFGASLDACTTPDPRMVLVTFDDAYVDCLEIAAPVLRRHGFGATIFAVTDHVGAWNSWNPRATYRRRHMGWSGLRDCLSIGLDVASHGCSHQSLPKLSAKAVLHECRDSKAILEDRLGAAVRGFAYPYGDYSPAVAAAVARHYPLGFAMAPGARYDLPLKTRIPRIPMGRAQDGCAVAVAAEISLWCLYGGRSGGSSTR